jgi:hypothetical protein
MNNEHRLVEVYRAQDGPQAHLFRMQLEEAGIPALVEGDQLQSAVGALPTGWSIAPRIMVEAAYAEQARRLLAEWESAIAHSWDNEIDSTDEADE